MQKWKYLRLQVDYDESENILGISANSEIISEETAQYVLQHILDGYGKDGWELVNVSQILHDKGIQETYYFKLPVKS